MCAIDTEQCCGSMTFWCGSGPDSDPDPAIFVNDLPDANKKLIFLKILFITF